MSSAGIEAQWDQRASSRVVCSAKLSWIDGRTLTGKWTNENTSEIKMEMEQKLRKELARRINEIPARIARIEHELAELAQDREKDEEQITKLQDERSTLSASREKSAEDYQPVIDGKERCPRCWAFKRASPILFQRESDGIFQCPICGNTFYQ